MDIAVPKYSKLGEGFSRREQATAAEHSGRRADGSQSAASWICDLTDLRKVVILCSFCRVKFNPRKNHYRRMFVNDLTGVTDGYQVNGRCDGCKQLTVNAGGGTAYVHEDEYDKVCVDPTEARRKARLASRQAWSTWSAVQHTRSTLN